jgi:arginine decarboxylase
VGGQATAQELFAEATGAKQTLFSTDGSSLSVHVAIMSVAGPGDTIVMARNGHKSSFAGLVLSGVRPVYVDPWYDEELEVAHVPLADDVARVLDTNPEARAGLIFTPSYYGTNADVRAIAEASTHATSRSSPTTHGDWTTPSAATLSSARRR